jgi:hypothetical protein
MKNFCLALKEALPPWRRFRLRMRLYALVAGLFCGYLVAIYVDEGDYDWALLPLGLVMAASVFELVIADIWLNTRYPASTRTVLDRLEIDYARLNVTVPAYMDELIRSLRGCDVRKVSGVIHLRAPLNTITGSEDGLVQLTGYSGARRGGAWRTTEASKGIIGRCLRSGQTETASFASQAEFERRMVSEFGFFKDEAARHSREGRSYLATPIKAAGRLVGVLYLYSTEPQVFPHALDEDQLDSTAAMIGAFLDGAVRLSELPQPVSTKT